LDFRWMILVTPIASDANSRQFASERFRQSGNCGAIEHTEADDTLPGSLAMQVGGMPITSS
jgi:hypothetical protein